MRIAVANLTSGGLSGGYRKYLHRLMPLLAQDARVSALTLYVPPGLAGQMDSSLDVRTWAPEDAGRGFSGLARDVASLAPDVVFVPTARWANFGSLPVVTMVRNMEPLTVPFGGNAWREGLKNVARAWEARRSCRRATRVIAVSEHVRDFVVTRWRIQQDRVGTVYHGVDQAGQGEPITGAERITVSPTLFTAGSIRPARGLEDVIGALAGLDPQVKLVIGGRVDAGSEHYGERLRRLAENLRVAGRITWAGQLDTAAMTRALTECTVFVMTSRAEACPNTVLEAMAAGCASVSVNRAPMPEFFGDAAQYYSAGDAPRLTHQLRALLASPVERARLGLLAFSRAQNFTWDATRDRTITELQRSLS